MPRTEVLWILSDIVVDASHRSPSAQLPRQIFDKSIIIPGLCRGPADRPTPVTSDGAVEPFIITCAVCRWLARDSYCRRSRVCVRSLVLSSLHSRTHRLSVTALVASSTTAASLKDCPHPRVRGGVMVRALDSRLGRSRVRISAVPLSGNNLGQVVHTSVPLSPSSIIWYWSRDGDDLQLGR